MDIDDIDLESLLEKAEVSLKRQRYEARTGNDRKESTGKTSNKKKQPTLDTGIQPKRYLKHGAIGGTLHVNSEAVTVVEGKLPVGPGSGVLEVIPAKTVLTAPTAIPTLEIDKKHKKVEPPNAGANWFDMTGQELTPELKQDLMVLKARGAIDPKHHFKRDDHGKGLPSLIQVGTIVSGAADFYNGRLTRKERKVRIVDQLLADAKAKKYLKSKYSALQAVSSSGRKRNWKKDQANVVKRRRKAD
ncbi:Fcf2 pre-rRNA processing-domain-containing protein [Cladochytrium replicatum]|nr:Fcf2 pre-rRNA processing-domain-containing protein [Cladochytrium replicatum]